MSKMTNAEAITSWSAMPVAAMDAYDDQGDFAKRHLLNRDLLRLLGPVAGRRVMDAGCGQGYFSRLLAHRGAEVIGVEPADALIRRARRFERQESLGIRFVQADLAELQGMDEQFDAVVCSMVLLSIPQWKGAMSTCVAALRPGGRFVFSVHHPAFESLLATWQACGHYRVDRYFDEYEIVGPHANDYHRPLSTYLNEMVALGCRLIELCEPRLDPKVAQESGIPGIEAYVNLPNFVVVAGERE